MLSVFCFFGVVLFTTSLRFANKMSSIKDFESLLNNTNHIVIKVGLDLMGNDISVSHWLPKPLYSVAVREGPQASSNTPSRASDVVVKFVPKEGRDYFYKREENS